ncbi:MAG TPA: lanthionine synthetase C family protein, partial [Umezawaea sp.]|nr:lanthionine synthetase C family protein [Umezawaea sp.]
FSTGIPDCSPGRYLATSGEIAGHLWGGKWPPTGILHWPRSSLAHGVAGTALLHIERAATDTSGWAAAHTSMRAAAAGPIDGDAHTGLFYGAPAISFMLHAAAACEPRHARTAAALDEVVQRVAHRRLVTATTRMDRGDPAGFTEFDLFSGLVGIGALLLRRCPDSDAVTGILNYLVTLTTPRTDHGLRVPGWWVAHDPDTICPTPGGHANFGMAHGAAGLLALLASATIRGRVVEGQYDAISALTRWFDRWRQDSSHGPWWPQWITRDELRSGRPTQREPGLPSWCYGAVGIARAQQLGAIATDDTSRRTTAEDTMAACLADRQLDRVTESGLCHGLAGIYQSAFRAANDAYSPAIAGLLPGVASRMAQHAATIGHHGNAGFLTGDAGVALACDTARYMTTPRSEWDACLLIV